MLSLEAIAVWMFSLEIFFLMDANFRDSFVQFKGCELKAYYVEYKIMLLVK